MDQFDGFIVSVKSADRMTRADPELLRRQEALYAGQPNTQINNDLGFNARLLMHRTAFPAHLARGRSSADG